MSLVTNLVLGAFVWGLICFVVGIAIGWAMHNRNRYDEKMLKIIKDNEGYF